MRVSRASSGSDLPSLYLEPPLEDSSKLRNLSARASSGSLCDGERDLLETSEGDPRGFESVDCEKGVPSATAVAAAAGVESADFEKGVPRRIESADCEKASKDESFSEFIPSPGPAALALDPRFL